MANAMKGEVDVAIGGQHYRLVLTTNSMCEVEDLLGRGWFDVAEEVQRWMVRRGKEATLNLPKVKISLVRALLWGCLREHHGHLSIADVGSMMQQIAGEGQTSAVALILETMTRSMPSPESEAENPPAPGQNVAPGTGPVSAEPGKALN